MIKQLSFNPCSYGSFVLTEFTHSYEPFNSNVSILVLMDLSFLQAIKVTIVKNDKKFQSLFLWIFRSYKKQTEKIVNFRHTFQSLFLWIFRSYIKMEQRSLKINKSFNPCSYGSFVLTYNQLKYESNFLKSFNPCSYGSFVLTKKERQQRRRLLRVSILVLMDLSFLPALTFKPVFFNGFVYFLHFAFCTV